MSIAPRRRWSFFLISALGLAIGLWGMKGLSQLSAFPLEPQLTKLHYGIVFIEGLIFFAVNFLVFCPRVDRGPVRDLYWCTLLYGIAIMVGGLYFPRTLAWTESILPLVWIACFTL